MGTYIHLEEFHTVFACSVCFSLICAPSSQRSVPCPGCSSSAVHLLTYLRRLKHFGGLESIFKMWITYQFFNIPLFLLWSPILYPPKWRVISAHWSSRSTYGFFSLTSKLHVWGESHTQSVMLSLSDIWICGICKLAFLCLQSTRAFIIFFYSHTNIVKKQT